VAAVVSVSGAYFVGLLELFVVLLWSVDHELDGGGGCGGGLW
jgi:hypothetical protein